MVLVLHEKKRLIKAIDQLLVADPTAVRAFFENI